MYTRCLCACEAVDCSRPKGENVKHRTCPAFLAAVAALLTGCVATVEERPARVVYVSGPPPAPLVESPAPPGDASMAWVEGYWHWNGVQYVWIPGHWESPPAGYVWVGPSYVIVGGRHAYRAGSWRRSDVAPR
jgi:hypothetical protein